MVLYVLTYGKLPFKLEEGGDIYSSQVDLDVKFPQDVSVEESLKDLIQKMICKCQRKRLSLEQVMAHP